MPVKNRRISVRKAERLIRALVILALGALPALLQADEARGYADQPAYKAIVQFGDAADKQYAVHGMPNRLAAASAAQNACLTAHPTQGAVTGYCEIVQLGASPVTSSRDIRARVPDAPHPLYLWRYAAGDAIVYAAGSIHILKPGLYPLPRQFQQAFDKADTLVVEVDLSAYSPQTLQFKYSQYGLLPDGQTLEDVLSPETFSALNTIGNEYGLPVAQMSRYKPAFITQQLALFALMSVGYDPEQSVERFFTQQVGHRTIEELETLDFQLDLLFNESLDVQRQMTLDTLDQLPAFEPLTADLITAWLAGDDPAFEKAFETQSGTSEISQAFMRKLMDDRNVGMADKIAGYLNTEGTYFVLAGAGHYVGDNSIIRILERRGIRGQRIYSNQDLK